MPDVPLFPLSTVLFPGTLLTLRIFEPRYLGMISECARGDSAFGICLILEGRESGAPATPAAIGTLAHIRDFSTLPDGFLGITVEGGQRFQITATRVRHDGLMRGRLRRWPDEPRVAVPVEFALLPVILERMLEQAVPEWDAMPRERLDDSSWVGFRLAELLPFDMAERQQLLEITDPIERLAELRDHVPRFQRP